MDNIMLRIDILVFLIFLSGHECIERGKPPCLRCSDLNLKNEESFKNEYDLPLSKRPNFSNILFQENMSKSEENNVIRTKRESKKPESHETLKRKMHAEKYKKDELMAADTNFRTENVSGIRRLTEPQFGGLKTEHKGNINNYSNNLMLLKILRDEKESKSLYPGAECNFEKECGWQWKTDIPNGFVRTSAQNYSEGESGPLTDADDRYTGKYYNI